MTGVVWHSPLLGDSGYADEARHLLYGLTLAGMCPAARRLPPDDPPTVLPPSRAALLREMLDRPDEPSAVAVFHTWMAELVAPHAGRRTVWRTMFDTDGVPGHWLPAAAEVDEVWVPARFNVWTFAQAGVPEEKLRTIPNCIDIHKFDGVPRTRRFDAGFVFLSVFRWQRRKGWDALLRAYFEEFSAADDVLLVIKTAGFRGEPFAGRDQLATFLDTLPRRNRPPRLTVIGNPLSEEEMLRLYAAADCYVLPSRGEGWGRPYMEAMLAGIPVIASRWGGQLDYLTDDNSFLVDCGTSAVTPFDAAEQPLYAGHRWGEPSVDHLRHLMRRVRDEPELAAAVAARGRSDVRASYSGDVVGRQVRAVIEELAAHD